jgi:phosphoglycerate dehydrogenase-like enzyme
MPDGKTIGYLRSFADDSLISAIRQVPGARLIVLDDAASVLSHAAELDALVTGGNEASYSAAVADALTARGTRLRWIQVTSAGHDALERFGVPDGVLLTGNGGAFGAPVADHAMALLLALARGLPMAMAPSAGPRWDRSRFQHAIGLDGRTVAIVGFGGIGRQVARRARAFGMNVIAISRSGRPSPEADEVLPASALTDALPRADAIVLCTPLTRETLHLMNVKTLQACRPGTLLVNVGRGRLVDTPALLDALRSGRIGGAGLDVAEPEPLPDDHALWTMPNVIITPHMAPAGAPGVIDEIAAFVAGNVERFVKGLPLEGVIAPS